ncbi:MAG TPA: effector-associated domain EAD1-containing protein [Thermoanaerobaculia bacterium]|nr:effector-associated domain EAD1-containing protein [Thermoanaerobaculia bacterium]
MALTPEDRTILIRALKRRYRSRDDLDRFLQEGLEQLDLSLAEISSEENDLEEARRELIDEAESEGWTPQLVAALRADSGPDVRNLLDRMQSPSVTEPENDDFWYVDGAPFVNRTDLRKGLTALLTDPGKRILIVNSGRRHCGHSHAREHVHQHAQRNDFGYVDIQLSEYASPDLPLRPYDLGLAICHRMGLDLPKKLIEPEAQRWSVNFLHWLPSALNPKRRWWIVIDDFGHEEVDVPDHVYDFVEQLCKKMATTLHGLRLVLISYAKELPPPLKYMVENDHVPAISDSDLLDYFLSVYREHRPPPASEQEEREVEQQVRKHAQAVRARMRGPAKEELQQMRDAVIDECELLRKGRK